MIEIKYIVLIFESTHKVLKAEKLLVAAGVKFDIIPTPKEFSTNCGMSIRMKPEVAEISKVKLLLEKQGIKFTIHEKIST